MATSVNNPTNAKPWRGMSMPFTSPKQISVLAKRSEEKDPFNNGKDYKDEGAPLLTNESSVKAQPRAFGAFSAGIIDAPTKDEVKALTQMDEVAQGTHIRYLKEAIVMDVDAKLILSTTAQMKRAMDEKDLTLFREAHYPTLPDYMNSPHYRRLRESQIKLTQLSRFATKTNIERATVAGIRVNPQLVQRFRSIDSSINKHLRESGYTKQMEKLREEMGKGGGRRLREDFFSMDGPPSTQGFGQLGPNFDGGQSFGLAGREPDFIPLIGGPYNKQLYFADYLDMHAKAYEAWCLTGDTEIALLDGRDIPILQLKEELKKKKFIWGYKFNQDSKRIEPVKMTNVYEMGKKDCVCVLLDNGRSFIASKDHPMLLQDGSYKESAKLLPGDSMMPIYRVYQRPKGEAGAYRGYERLWQPLENRWELTHVAVMKAVSGKTEKDLFWKHGKKYVIHHKKHKRDNRPEKLANWSEARHMKYHGRQGKEILAKLWADPNWKKEHLALLKIASNTPEAIEKKIAPLRGKIQSKEAIRNRINSRLNNGKPWHSKKTKKKISNTLNNHKVLAVYDVGWKTVYHVETAEKEYSNQNFALSIGVFSHNTHNPVAKRICKVITQFVLGKGVKITVMEAKLATGRNIIDNVTGQKTPEINDYREQCQTKLDGHWMKNAIHIRSKQILRDLIIFGEQFIRYYDAPWGLKLRSLDPSTVWEVITDPDDCENEFYIHQQYPTRYQWFVDLPVPTIKFIIRQVPALLYYHMKINCTSTEVRGRSELFAILGWLKRLKEFASDRVIRNKMANLFVLDVAVEGDASAVQAVQQQMATPPTPGSFFFHNKAAELKGVAAEVGAGEVNNDWELLLTVVSMGAGLSQQYLGMSAGGGKAEALVGTEPDIKTFEDYQEIMESFFLQDAQRLFQRCMERKELPPNLNIKVEVTYPALAEENRSEKLKDLAFGESMSWWSHRRIASAAAKEMQFTSYDYDEEQVEIAAEDAKKLTLINTAYQQVTKGTDSATAGAGSGGTSSGSSGKGASGMGMGKLPGAGSSSSKQSGTEAVREAGEEADEDEMAPATAPGTSAGSSVSGMAVTHNASVGSDGKKDPWAGRDPRDVAEGIKREAANLRYDRHAIGRRNDRIQSPDKIRDQRTLDRGTVLGDAKKARHSGNLGHESKTGVTRNGITRFPRYKESYEPYKPQDGDKLQHPKVMPVEDHQGMQRDAMPDAQRKMKPRGFGDQKRESSRSRFLPNGKKKKSLKQRQREGFYPEIR